METGIQKTTNGIGCSRLTVKFKDRLRQSVEHTLGSPTGARLMVVYAQPDLNLLVIDYVTVDGTVLRAISYAREDIHEISFDEGVCEVTV